MTIKAKDEAETTGAEPHVLYGNEGYISDHGPSGRSVPPPPITQEDWLMEAIPAVETLMRGDIVSAVLIERLFLQAFAVIDEFVPAGSRKKTDGKADAKKHDDK